jgi:hypothetical protein
MSYASRENSAGVQYWNRYSAGNQMQPVNPSDAVMIEEVQTDRIKTDFTTPTDLTVITGSQKTIVLDSIVWDDSMVAPTAFRSGGTALTFDLLTATIYTHRFDVNDQIHVVVQFPHSIKLNSGISPHIHIINKNAIGNTGYNVAFDLHYTWANIGSIFPSELNQLNVKQSFQNVAALTHKMLTFTTINPTAVQGGISSIFLAKITRVAADSEPYNTNDIFTLGFDIHFQKDTIGSRQTGVK